VSTDLCTLSTSGDTWQETSTVGERVDNSKPRPQERDTASDMSFSATYTEGLEAESELRLRNYSYSIPQRDETMVTTIDCTTESNNEIVIKTEASHDEYYGVSEANVSQSFLRESEYDTHNQMYVGQNTTTIGRGIPTEGPLTESYSRLPTEGLPIGPYGRRSPLTEGFSRSSYSHSFPTVELPKGPYSRNCGQCGKLATSKYDYDKHVRIHTGEKPFKCRYCERAFAQVGNLNIHERIHTGDRRHQCHVCGRTLCSKVSLVTHYSTVHALGPSDMPQ
jgi:hypothetical protein